MEWVRKSKDLLQSDLKLVKFQEWLENLADDVCQLQNTFPSNSKYKQKQVIKLKNLIVGKQYEIHTAELVQTKFGETVLLELEKNVVFLPQRETNEYKPQIAYFSPEKYAVIFRGTKDVEKPYPAASFGIIESK
ncbi:hypothetical protein JTB14_020322 [Gonioctena quinquepunctata]|nr:hypothetical protein JTB14_020322 [Gonioctena quinquepunctata]